MPREPELRARREQDLERGPDPGDLQLAPHLAALTAHAVHHVGDLPELVLEQLQQLLTGPVSGVEQLPLVKAVLEGRGGLHDPGDAGRGLWVPVVEGGEDGARLGNGPELHQVQVVNVLQPLRTLPAGKSRVKPTSELLE